MKTNLFKDTKELQKIALSALKEVTSDDNVGKFIDTNTLCSNSIDVKYKSRLRGYRDWVWHVSLSKADKKSKITVNEVNLISPDDKQFYSEKLTRFKHSPKDVTKILVDDYEIYKFNE